MTFKIEHKIPIANPQKVIPFANPKRKPKAIAIFHIFELDFPNIDLFSNSEGKDIKAIKIRIAPKYKLSLIVFFYNPFERFHQ